MYESILVPTDGSDEMERVVEHALFLADQCDATLHVLHAVDDRAYATIPDEARSDVRDALESDGHDATRTIAQRAIDRGVAVEREVRWGNPPASILAYAEENDVDLIVMGTHGRTGYERYLLGSVAEKVVRAATVPVMTVYVGDEDDARLDLDLPEDIPD